MLAGSLQQLVQQIEVKDATTASHTWRVVLYARAMAEKFGLKPEMVRRVTQGAALHDVGKVDIPDVVLQKPGPLNDAEREVMQLHPRLGYEKLVHLGETDEVVLAIVRSHHERIDGQGYPDHLGGEAIPPGPRYFAVIDAFDAMTSPRPYRPVVPAEGVERALEELHAGIGTRYCAEAVGAFVEMFRAGELEWIRRHFSGVCELPAYCGGEASEVYAAGVRRG